jgi:transcriptional regulator with XRE-family HTH domain
MLTPREHKAGFAARLVRAREGTDCASRAEFSRRLGFTVPETYRRYERGETEQDLAMLTKIQEITGVDLNWLVAGTPLVAQTDWLSHKETAVWSWVSDAKHIITLGDIPRSIIHTDAKAAHLWLYALGIRQSRCHQ